MPNSAAMQLGSSSPANGVWRDAGSSTMTKSRVQIYDKVYGFQNVGVQTANDGSCYGIDSFPMEANTDYVISMDARITAGTEGYAGFALYDYTPLDGSYSKVDKNYYVTPLTTSWTRCWLHFKTGSNTSRNVYIGVTTGSTSVTTQMCKVKIEKGSIPTPWIPKSTDTAYTSMGYNSTTEYDVSGYGYNGTKNGTMTYSSDTARYSISTEFSKAGHIVNSSFGLTTNAFTVNFWVKLKTASSQHFVLGTFDNWTSNGFGLYREKNSTTYQSLIKSTTESTYKQHTMDLTGSVWQMLTYVYTGTHYKGYLNGTLKFDDTYGSNGNVSHPTLVIANSYFSGTPASENEEAFLSDFRFYATALSDTQITELYNTAVSVANNGTLMGYELVEV